VSTSSRAVWCLLMLKIKQNLATQNRNGELLLLLGRRCQMCRNECYLCMSLPCCSCESVGA